MVVGSGRCRCQVAWRGVLGVKGAGQTVNQRCFFFFFVAVVVLKGGRGFERDFEETAGGGGNVVSCCQSAATLLMCADRRDSDSTGHVAPREVTWKGFIALVRIFHLVM